MRALQVQKRDAEALDCEANLSKDTTEKDKRPILSKAHSAILLFLGEKSLREVSKEKTMLQIQKKLEELYMDKSVQNKLHLKQKLYFFKVYDDKSMVDQLDEFSKVLDELQNVKVKLEDEDKNILLLNALPKSLEHFKDTMIYNCITVTLDQVQTFLKS